MLCPSDAEAVDGSALALKSIDDVQGCHGLAPGMLSVRDGVAQHILQECLKHATALFVDQSADALDSTSTCQATNGGLCDAVDVVLHDLPSANPSPLADWRPIILLSELVALEGFSRILGRHG